jgi:CRISPR-associated protein Cmr2
LSEQSQWMLMFSLGPVQPWIEQARKARDLWLGSLLLSTLMEAAMAGIQGEFVFPTVRTVGKTPDIPNKYVALFNSAREAEEAAGISTRHMKKYWEGICQDVLDHIVQKHGDQKTMEIWQRQTQFERLFEIYWAITPDPLSTYEEWLGRAEQMLGARKRLRNFQAQNEPGEKSAISGEREVLHWQQADGASMKQFWIDMAAGRPRDIDATGGERLDSIDVIKRFATIAEAIKQKRAFPSTSSIATAPFVEQLLTHVPAASLPETTQRWDSVLDRWNTATQVSSLRKPAEATEDIPFLAYLGEQAAFSARKWLLRLDGDLYFPAIFAPRRMEKDYEITDQRVVERGKEALRRLRNTVSEMDIARPTPYYGVIQMDGDHMGKLLGTANGKEKHKQISQALSTFAHTVALPLVEDAYPARLIYAGGDDVLAFAPLARERREADQPATILELVEMLQTRYTNIVSAVLPPSHKGTERRRATASTGIAIAHHYTSLSYVLRSARAAEQAAKRRYGRNALVVTLLRRSGEQTQVGCHWHYPQVTDPDGQPIRLFMCFYTLFKKDILSPKCVHLLLAEAPALVGLPDEAQVSEVKRILLRQLDLCGQSDEEKAKLKKDMGEQAGRLVALARAMDQGTDRHHLALDLHVPRRRYGLVEVSGWLLVMTFLARKDQDWE